MNKKLYILIGLFILVILAGFLVNRKIGSTEGFEVQVRPSPTMLSPSPSETIDNSPKASSIPSSYLILDFPFQSQAPLGNWDALHEESCEEASLILVKYYQNKKTLSADVMENEIQKMVAWETANGYPQDITVSQLSKVALNYYKMSKPTVEYDITISDIKKEISLGRPVIIPAAGQLLGNPYYTAPGPVYHNVVVIGYQGNDFIVQDVGTRRGDGYRFNQEIFYNAIHDWAGSKDNITSGRKAMLVFD